MSGTTPKSLSRDYRDLCIEDLTDRCADLQQRRDFYKLALIEALGALHTLSNERDHYRERYHAALDELRRLRSQVITRNDLGKAAA